MNRLKRDLHPDFVDEFNKYAARHEAERHGRPMPEEDDDFSYSDPTSTTSQDYYADRLLEKQREHARELVAIREREEQYKRDQQRKRWASYAAMSNAGGPDGRIAASVRKAIDNEYNPTNGIFDGDGEKVAAGVLANVVGKNIENNPGNSKPLQIVGNGMRIGGVAGIVDPLFEQGYQMIEDAIPDNPFTEQNSPGHPDYQMAKIPLMSQKQKEAAAKLAFNGAAAAGGFAIQKFPPTAHIGSGIMTSAGINSLGIINNWPEDDRIWDPYYPKD